MNCYIRTTTDIAGAISDRHHLTMIVKTKVTENNHLYQVTLFDPKNNLLSVTGRMNWILSDAITDAFDDWDAMYGELAA